MIFLYFQPIDVIYVYVFFSLLFLFCFLIIESLYQRFADTQKKLDAMTTKYNDLVSARATLQNQYDQERRKSYDYDSTLETYC